MKQELSLGDFPIYEPPNPSAFLGHTREPYKILAVKLFAEQQIRARKAFSMDNEFLSYFRTHNQNPSLPEKVDEYITKRAIIAIEVQWRYAPKRPLLLVWANDLLNPPIIRLYPFPITVAPAREMAVSQKG